MDSDATDTAQSDAPGSIRSPAGSSSSGAVRQAGRPNRGLLRHRPDGSPDPDELLERSRTRLVQASGLPLASPRVVPGRQERQTGPSLSPLGDDFDLDAAVAELISRNAEPASRFQAWRRRSATGALLTGIALGLNQVFEPERKEPNIVLETSGQPPRQLPIEADLDQVLPRDTVIKVRPWLLAGAAGASVAARDAAARTSFRLALLAPVGALGRTSR